MKDALSLFVDFMAIFVSSPSPPLRTSLPLHSMCVSQHSNTDCKPTLRGGNIFHILPMREPYPAVKLMVFDCLSVCLDQLKVVIMYTGRPTLTPNNPVYRCACWLS